MDRAFITLSIVNNYDESLSENREAINQLVSSGKVVDIRAQSTNELKDSLHKYIDIYFDHIKGLKE